MVVFPLSNNDRASHKCRRCLGFQNTIPALVRATTVNRPGRSRSPSDGEGREGSVAVRSSSALFTSCCYPPVIRYIDRCNHTDKQTGREKPLEQRFSTFSDSRTT